MCLVRALSTYQLHQSKGDMSEAMKTSSFDFSTWWSSANSLVVKTHNFDFSFRVNRLSMCPYFLYYLHWIELLFDFYQQLFSKLFIFLQILECESFPFLAESSWFPQDFTSPDLSNQYFLPSFWCFHFFLAWKASYIILSLLMVTIYSWTCNSKISSPIVRVVKSKYSSINAVFCLNLSRMLTEIFYTTFRSGKFSPSILILFPIFITL